MRHAHPAPAAMPFFCLFLLTLLPQVLEDLEDEVDDAEQVHCSALVRVGEGLRLCVHGVYAGVVGCKQKGQ